MCLRSGSRLLEGHIHLHFSYSVLSAFLLAAVSLMDSLIHQAALFLLLDFCRRGNPFSL